MECDITMLARGNQSDDATLATNATPNIPQLSKSKISIKKLLKMRMSDSAVSQNEVELPDSGSDYLTRTGSLEASSSQSLVCENELILLVECGTNKAELYLSKLCMGSKGRSIKFHGSWLTPNEFQYVSGRETAKDWKRSIRHHGKSLKLLLTKNIMKSDAQNPTCDCEGCKPDGKSECGIGIEKDNSQDIFSQGHFNSNGCDATWDVDNNNEIVANTRNQNGPVFPGMILEEQNDSEDNSDQDSSEEITNCKIISEPHLPLDVSTDNGKTEETVEEYRLQLNNLLGNTVGSSSEIFPVEEGSSLHSLMSMCTSEGMVDTLFEKKSQEKEKIEVIKNEKKMREIVNKSESKNKTKDEIPNWNCLEDMITEKEQNECNNEKKDVDPTSGKVNFDMSQDPTREEVNIDVSHDAFVSPDSLKLKATFGNVFDECIEKHYSQDGETHSDTNVTFDLRRNSDDDITSSNDQEALDLEKKRICAKIAWPPSFKDDYLRYYETKIDQLKGANNCKSDLKKNHISQVLTATKDSMKAMVNARQKDVKAILPVPTHQMIGPHLMEEEKRQDQQLIQNKIKDETPMKKETSSSFFPPISSPGGLQEIKISSAAVAMSPTDLQMAQSYYWTTNYNDYMQYLGKYMYHGKLTDIEYLNYLRHQQNRWYGVGTLGTKSQDIGKDLKTKQTGAGLKNLSQNAKLYSMEHNGKHGERNSHQNINSDHISNYSKNCASTNKSSLLKRSHSIQNSSERLANVDALDLTSKKSKIDNVSTRNPYYPYYPPLCYPQIPTTGNDVVDLSRPSKLDSSLGTPKDVVKDLLLGKRLPVFCADKTHEKDVVAALNWNVQEVFGFVASIEVCSEYAPILKLHQIDGKSLPYLTPDILTSHMGMKLGPALALKAAIQKVTGCCHQCSHCLLCHNKK